MIRKIILLFVILDNTLTQSLKGLFPARWKLEGECRRCGNCCREIYLKMTPNQMKSKLFTNISIRWISWLFDFNLLQTDREHHYLIFNCKHLTSDGKCGNYFWRPNICRNYPLVDYFEEPKFLPGCGFKAKPRSY